MGELNTYLQNPAVRSAVQDLLDDAVAGRALEYYFAQTAPLEKNESGIPIAELSVEHDTALMELVMMSDARARSEDSDFTMTGPLEWTYYARRGLRRMSRYFPDMRAYRHARPFSGDPNTQLEAYDAMKDRLIVVQGPPLEEATPIEYATRVLIREIAIDKSRSYAS